MSNTQKPNEKLFSEWLSRQVSPHKLTEIFLCYLEIEKYGKRTKILKDDFFNTKEVSVLNKLRADIEANKAFRFQHKKQMKNISLALKLYISYLKEIKLFSDKMTEEMSADSKKNTNTIREAIIQVLNENTPLLSVSEIYNRIINLRLYVFGAQSPLHEWIDVVISAVDYNPDGYVDEFGNVSEEKKLYFLRRLLPFVEKRVNLIELAPKGTGKSYIFEKISKRGWLISGGTVSRATLIYDNSKKTGGLLTRFDYVGFDEVQSITFEQPGQIQQALKHYMEFGEIKGFDAQMSSDAGVIVLGNIDAEKFNIDRNMVENISEVFGESATMDRFHGFIPGWEIPRMKQDMIANGWAINTEYFAEILHALREDLVFAAIVDDCIDIPSKADKRDLTAIKRLCTAFLKLLFPHVNCKEDIDPDEFITYCLNPAKEMRAIIKHQLCIIDPKEFNVPGKNTIPDIQFKY